MDKAETIYTEEHTGRRYKKKGCSNGLCMCSGDCEKKIYLDPETKKDYTSEMIKDIDKYWEMQGDTSPYGEESK